MTDSNIQTNLDSPNVGGTLMKVLSVMNEKGGVGKTTLVSNLGVAAALRGIRVLLVDFDPQGDLTERFLVPRGEPVPQWDVGLMPALLERGRGIRSEDLIRVDRPDCELYVMPCDKRMSNKWSELPAVPGALLLKQLLAPLSDRFDLIIIDTPGTGDSHAFLPVVASDYVLCPTELKGPSDKGARTILEMLEDAREGLGTYGVSPEFLGLVATQRDKRESMQKELFEAFTAQGKFFCDAEIQPNAAIGRQHMLRLTSFNRDPETDAIDKKGIQDFDAIAVALLARIADDIARAMEASSTERRSA